MRIRVRKTGKLSFGERMREWRKARKEYADKIKEKVKEQMDIKQNHPPQPGLTEKQTLVTSPTETTEMKKEEGNYIYKPNNVLEQAINRLREQAAQI